MKKLILPVLYNRISIYTNRYINVCILKSSVRLVMISITCSNRDVQLVVVVIINK